MLILKLIIIIYSNTIYYILIVAKMNEIKDKIAIVGFGASGFGTYLGLKEKDSKIYIYNQLPFKKEIDVKEWNLKNLKINYKYLKIN